MGSNRHRLAARLAASAALLGAIAATLIVAVAGSSSTPEAVSRAANEAWTAQGCDESERFLHQSLVGKPFPNSAEVYVVRCQADNPTGLIAVVGTYDRPSLARRDAAAYRRGPACVARQLVVVGFFFSPRPQRNAPEKDTTVEGMRSLCSRLDGAYVR